MNQLLENIKNATPSGTSLSTSTNNYTSSSNPLDIIAGGSYKAKNSYTSSSSNKYQNTDSSSKKGLTEITTEEYDGNKTGKKMSGLLSRLLKQTDNSNYIKNPETEANIKRTQSYGKDDTALGYYNIGKAEEALVTETAKEKNKDTFGGQFDTNFNLGKMTQNYYLAQNNVLKNPTEENKAYANQLKNAIANYQTINADVLDSEGQKAPILSRDVAQYLPQLGNQISYSMMPAIGGFLVGGAAGAKAGLVAGSGAYSYDVMRGAAYSNLIDAGVDEETARAAAKDEALISSMVEMGDTALDLITLGGGKVLSMLGKGGAVTSTATKSISKEVAKILAGYGINIKQEGVEEGLQECISIANERNLGQNKGALALGWQGLKLYLQSFPALANTFGENTLTDEDVNRIRESERAGRNVATVMGGMQTAGNTLASQAIYVNNELNDNASWNAALGTEAMTDINEANKFDTTVPTNEVNSYTKLANDILADEQKAMNFRREFGGIKGNSREEQVKYIIEKIRGKQLEGRPVDTTKPQNAETMPGAEHVMAQPQTQNVDAYNQIADMQEQGINYSEANKIYSNPLLRQAFQDISGTTLSDNKKQAQNQIIAWGKNSPDYSQVDLGVNTPTETAQNEQIATDSQITPQNVENQNLVANDELNSAPTNAQPQTTTNEQKAQPISDVETARAVEAQMPERGTAMREEGNSRNIRTDNSMNPELRKSYEDNPEMQKVARNKDTLRKALDVIDKNGISGALSILQQELTNAKNGQKMSLESVPLTKILSNELMKGSENEKAIARQITSDLGAELMYAGQFGQANIILRNSDPITARQSIDKFIDNINQRITQKFNNRYKYRAELTADEIAQIDNTDFLSDPEAYERIITQIENRISKEMPSTLWQKMMQFRRTAMLSAPSTHLANTLANIPTVGLRAMDNAFSGAMQSLGASKVKLEGAEVPIKLTEGDNAGKWMSIVNGNEFLADSEESCKLLAKAEKFGKTRAAFYGQEEKSIAKDIYNQVKDSIADGTNKWDSAAKVMQDQTIFKPIKFKIGNKTIDLTSWGEKNANWINNQLQSKFGIDSSQITDASALQTWSNFIYWAMEAEDKPFVKGAFVNSLASYCKARGITSADQVTEEAIAHATTDALYYTYKSNNSIADIINGIKRSGINKNGAVDTLGKTIATLAEIKIPFVTTLANIGAMALEHDPFIAAAKTGAERAFGASKIQQIDSLAKGMSGGTVIALGYALAAAGALTGDKDEDKRKANYEKASGKSPNALLGRLDISQFQPASTLLSFGANLYYKVNDPNNESGFWGNVFDAMLTSANGIMNMEMMQNIAELFSDDNQYSDSEGFKALVESMIEDIPGQYIPSIHKSTVDAFDDTNRYSYTDGNVAENVLAALKYYSGIGRPSLPEKADVKGNTSKGKNRLITAIDSLLWSGTINQNEASKVDSFVYGIEKETGSKNVYPDLFYPGDTFTDSTSKETVTLTTENTAKFQKTYWNAYEKGLTNMMNSKEFASLDAKSKASVISTLKSYAKDVAIAEAFKASGKSYTSDTQDLVNGNKEKDLPALGSKTVDYLAYKGIFDSAVSNNNYKLIDTEVDKFQKLDKSVREVLFAKDSDIKNLVNANDYDVSAKEYYDYKKALATSAKEYDVSTTNSTAKVAALANSGINPVQLQNIIANNVFDLSATSLAVVDVLSQPPYNVPLNEVARFIYETDYTMNQKYENNDIIDLGKKSVNETTRKLAKDIDNGIVEKNDENIERLYGALVMEDANVNGIEGGTANGTLSNLEVARSLSEFDNQTIKENSGAIYKALREKLSNYYNDWGNYSYQSEVNYLPKAKAKGYSYGRQSSKSSNSNPLLDAIRTA